jgi:Domain of unknown function (DUF1844)
VAEKNPNPATGQNAGSDAGIPGSAVPDHPITRIPLPAHGFETLDEPVRALGTLPAAEVISRAAVALISTAAESLGLAPGEEPDLDLEEARVLITGLAGLLAASQESLGERREPLLAGLRTLQNAFREASAYPDAPGEGPGEKLLS